MRKILLTGMTAALALGLTACNGDGDGTNAAKPASPAPSASTRSDGAAPSGAPAPSGKASASRDDSGGSDPSPSGGLGNNEDESPIRQGARQIKSKWGPLRYLASGKFTVGDTAFFTTEDTVLIVAGGTCPDGTSSGPGMRCGIDGIDEWVQKSPHNVTVYFSGGNATKIQETQ